MAELFATGQIVELILLLLVLESVMVLAWARRTGRVGLEPGLLGNTLAGAGLLLALRGALAGVWWGWIAFWLALALLAHAVDLWRRCAAETARSP